MSDNATGSEDADMHSVLGNFSTVEETAFFLAKHMFYPSQMGIVSSEPGVGAIVARDINGWTNITWVNNTWYALGNALVCNNDTDIKMLRIQYKVRDIIDNQTSCNADNLLYYRDVIQRLAKDIDSGHGVASEPYGYEGTYAASGISPPSARSAMVAVCGNASYDGALNLLWMSFGQTLHLSLFLPLSATYLKSAHDIPEFFSQGDGLEAYTDVKQAYAEASSNQYYRFRVHEILNYTLPAENLTFDEYETALETMNTCSDRGEAMQRMKRYAETSACTALNAYEKNLTWYATNATLSGSYKSGADVEFFIYGLFPGTVYYYCVYADNKYFQANGTMYSVMTKPDHPAYASATYVHPNTIRLWWMKGTGAHMTLIERNTIPIWRRGTGTVVYNGTGTSYEDTNLTKHVWYYYQFWSFTADEDVYEYSLRHARARLCIPSVHATPGI